MFPLNVETLVTEYCAHSVVMNKVTGPEHMGFNHLLSAMASFEHFQDIDWCINTVRLDITFNLL